MRTAIILLAALGLHLFASPAASAQQSSTTCADWLAVQRWSGTITYNGSGSSTSDNGNFTSQTSEHATATFTTAKSPTTCDLENPSGGGWEANSTGSGQISLSVTMHNVTKLLSSDSNGQSCTLTTHYDVDNGTSQNPNAQIDMQFTGATAGKYTIAVSSQIDGVKVSSSGCGNSSTSTQSLLWGPQIDLPQGAVPGTYGPLVGTFNLQDSASVAWTENYNFQPYANYDVVLTTNPDLSTWRPTGSSNETTPAGILGFIAVVTDKDTGEHVSESRWTVGRSP